MTSKLFLKREISIIHLIMLLTSKLFIGLSIGLMFSDFAFPYSYPILVVGVLIFLPAILYLFKKEKTAESTIKQELKKKGIKRKKRK